MRDGVTTIPCLGLLEAEGLNIRLRSLIANLTNHGTIHTEICYFSGSHKSSINNAIRYKKIDSIEYRC